MLQQRETGWTVKHEMEYRVRVITDIPLATIEWE